MSESAIKKARTGSKKPLATSGKPTIAGRVESDDVTAEVKIDPHNPIPLELENTFGFSAGGNKFIPFFAGEDKTYGFNSFFINILRARQESTTQNACIVAKTKYTIGDGIFIDGQDKDGSNDRAWTDFNKRANVDGKNFNTVLKEIIEYYYTFGNVCIEIVKGEIGGKRFLYVYCKNTLDCRKAWPDENNTSNAVVISRWFRKPGIYNLTQRFNIRIPFYRSGPGSKNKYWLTDAMAKEDPNSETSLITGGKPTGIKVYRTAIWIKDEYPGYDHYGLPSWLSSLIFGKLEYESAYFNLDNLDNNMNPGGLLDIDASLSDPETDKMGRKINKQYLGKGKRGRIIVVASEKGQGGATKYTPFPTTKDGSYESLMNISRDEIISANEWDGALIGKSEKGTMGKGGSYMNELYQQKIKTVVRPLHTKIKDEFLTPLCEIADEWLGTNWSSYDLDIQVSNLFDDTTEASTTVLGISAFIEIVKQVSTGAWPLDAAVKFVALRYGMDEKEAADILGQIKVIVPPDPTKEPPKPKDK